MKTKIYSSCVNARAVVSVLTILFLKTLSVGQANTGTILGTVKDAAGAAVPSATVTVTNVRTQVTTIVSTNDAGDYIAPFQLPGEYQVSVEQINFKKAVRSGITLQVGEKAKADITLEIGEISETVTATAEAPLVRSEGSEIAQVIEGRPIVELPLSSATGRNFTGLVTLVPGTIRTNPVGLFDAPQGNSSFSVNGQRDGANNYTVDGADNNESLLGIVSVLPPPDAIAEFKIQTNSYAAEFGRAGGAVVSVATRSGTNDLHGSVYEFIRNDAFDARGPFDGAKLPSLRQNEYGGSIGGPIKKNRTFFFFDYVHFKQRAGQSFITTVPTLLQRQGIFLASEGAPPIFNPFTGEQFVNNTIPADMIDPIAQSIINLYPLPNLPGTVVENQGVANNFSGTSEQQQDADRFDLRIDHVLTEKDNLSGRYSFFNAKTAQTPLFGEVAIGSVPSRVGQGDARNQNLALTDIHTFSSDKINELRVAYSRIVTNFFGFDSGENTAADLGIPNINIFGDTSTGLPVINIEGLTSLGTDAPIPAIRTEENYQLVDNFTYIRGAHNLKFGVDLRRFRGDFFQISLESPRGRFDFDRNFTSDDGRVDTGLGVASLLLGFPSLERRGVISDTPRNRLTQYFFFAQDDFKVSRKLTINYGLRYEYYSPAVDQRDNQSNFDIASGQVLLAGRGDNSRSLVTSDKNNFAPRIGFAYSVNDRTVIRSGYGISYFPDKFGASGGTLNTNFPFITLQQINPPDPFTPAPALSLESGIAPPTSADLSQPSLALVGDITAFDPDYKIGYVQFWNLTVQRQLFSDLVLEAAYVGTKGTHLFGNLHVNLNQPEPGPGPLDPRRPFASIAPEAVNIFLRDSSQSSIYHSLQAKAEKRFGRGLYFLNSYTWSKSIDDAAFAIDPQNVRGTTRGPSTFDVRHLFTNSTLYELPVGRGRRFGTNMNSILDGFIGGWQVNGIYTFRTGLPATVSLSSGLVASTLNNGGANRPDLVGDPNLPSDERTIERFFNTDAFAAPPTDSFRFGNIGRNTIRGPNFSNLDLSVFKTFYFQERYALQFRSEFFNLPNHPNYGLPNTTLGTAGFGTISSLAGNNRQIQFALKFSF